jgi:hypothetical protein
MTDPYDIHDAATASVTAPAVAVRTGVRRPVLWVLLVVSAAANTIATSAGLNVLVGVGFGVLTLACVTALVVDHVAHRSR